MIITITTKIRSPIMVIQHLLRPRPCQAQCFLRDILFHFHRDLSQHALHSGLREGHFPCPNFHPWKPEGGKIPCPLARSARPRDRPLTPPSGGALPSLFTGPSPGRLTKDTPTCNISGFSRIKQHLLGPIRVHFGKCF